MKNLRKLIKGSMFLLMLFTFAVCSSGCLEDLLDDDETTRLPNLVSADARACPQCASMVSGADVLHNEYLRTIDNGGSSTACEWAYDVHRESANAVNTFHASGH